VNEVACPIVLVESVVNDADALTNLYVSTSAFAGTTKANSADPNLNLVDAHSEASLKASC
jgi:hypothetical protein